MIRRIITINEEKRNGCGICANACHEGAVDIDEFGSRELLPIVQEVEAACR